MDLSYKDTYHPGRLAYERTTPVYALDWVQEFDAINLPHFERQYIQLVHIPLDVMHECLKLQLELQLPDTSSHLSVEQVITCICIYIVCVCEFSSSLLENVRLYIFLVKTCKKYALDSSCDSERCTCCM